eukprot:jgi/Mesvir1/995/Mv17535-RA.1
MTLLAASTMSAAPEGVPSSSNVKKEKKYCPTNEDACGFATRASFSWVRPLIRHAAKHSLDFDDLCLLRDSSQAQVLGNKLSKLWERHVAERLQSAKGGRASQKSVSLGWVLLRMQRRPLITLGVMMLFESMLRISQGIVLRKLIDYVNGVEESRVKGYIFAVLMGLMAFSFAFQHHIAFFAAMTAGMRCRVAAMAEVHRKLLRLSASGLAGTTSGQCVNLVSTDVRRFDELLLYIHYIWVAPLELIVVTCLVGAQLGWQPALAGACCLVALMPLQGAFGRLFAKYRVATVKFTDKRVKTIGEILQGMLGVKMFGWEMVFTNSVSEVRAGERRSVEKAATVRAFNEAFFFVSQLLMSLVTFGTLVAIGEQLTPAKLFFTLALFSLPRLSMGSFFPVAIEKISEAYVTCSRLQRFLLLEEATGVSHPGMEPISGSASQDSTKAALTNTSSITAEPTQCSNGGAAVCAPPSADTCQTTPESERESNHESNHESKHESKHESNHESNHPVEQIPSPPGPATGEPASACQVAAPDDTQGYIVVGPPPAGLPIHALVGGNGSSHSHVMTEHSYHPALAVCVLQVQGDSYLPEASPLPTSSMGSLPRVEMTDASFSWGNIQDGNKGPHHLRGITCNVQDRQLLAVIGKVGSGKSSLLGAILGEMHLKHGSFNVHGRLSYVAQQPFIMAGSVRENILFGSEFNEERYKDVIDACALYADLASLPDADLTEIEERGANLSGGQRARVALARAAYAAADIALLDDPLSAVDPGVAKHLFSRCIRGLLSDRTVVLVTHQLQFLPECDYVFVMDDGVIAHKGTYDQLRKVLDFSSVLDDEAGAGASPVKQRVPVGPAPRHEEIAPAPAAPAAAAAHRCSIDIDQGLAHPLLPVSLTQTHQATAIESRSTGSVKLWVVLAYIKYMGFFTFTVVMALMVGGQAAYILSDWFLANWARSKPGGEKENLRLYGVLIAATVALSFSRAPLFFYMAIRAASRLHAAMLRTLLRAPLSFFHKNPAGRVLNRFAADQGTVDDQLPLQLFSFFQLSFICLGTLVLVVMGVPWVALLIVPLFLVFLRLRMKFMSASRDTKRLEAVTRSPVLSFFSASLQGLTTIHAFGMQAQFHEAFMDRLNRNSRAFYSWSAIQRWLGFRCDCLVAATILAASLVAVIARDHLSPTLVGLALTYSLQLSGMLQWTVRQSAELENLLVSVERMLEYTQLPQEAALEVPDQRPPPGWPHAGAISIQNLTVRYYEDLPPVLTGVSVDIPAGSKCGIVGRTGAGKSSLMLALFRLMEPLTGRMVIDGVDTSKIGLHDLRRKIAAIPQNPILFGNSLRFNLDPFREYTEEDTWKALAAVQLKGKVSQLEGGLDGTLSECGDNFSVGERQLLCMARAMLHRCRVLVMDEATANADYATDAMIQAMLREIMFQGTTVLVIAHRIDTIIDADNVLVLDKGSVAEYGPPKELLDRPGSFLAAMVEQTGPASQRKLLHKARASFDLRTAERGAHGVIQRCTTAALRGG